MKKIRTVLIIICVILIIVVIGIVISYINTKDKIEFKQSYTIKIGEKLPKIEKYLENKDLDIKHLEKVKNIKINWKDMKLDNDKIYYSGIYRGTFVYNKENYDVKLKVIDDIKPSIEGVKNIEIFVNDKVDFYKNIKITDNSKDEIKKEVVGDYSFSKKGTYNLKYVIIDKSNNKIEKEFKLIVKEKPVVQLPIENNNKEVPSTSSRGYKIEQKNGAYYINGILVANKTYSLSSSYNPGGLTSTFMNNYNQMNNAAKADGINLKIISGFRSYSTQKTLYNNYVARDGKAAADRYSARAGHSEHQTGLAADINSLEQSWENTKEGKWLNDNCYKYGFIIRYPKGKESITGYMFEPWHIRYVGVDVATIIYNNGNWSTLEEYLGIDSKY